MYACDDVDLMVWEPGIFGADAFGHQNLVKSAAGTLTGTALVSGPGALSAVAPGMVAIVDAGGGLTQLLEVTALADTAHATLSALRGRADEAAIAGLVSGVITFSVMSFRPQIAGIGDELLGLLGVASDRTQDGAEDLTCGKHFRAACVFGTLARIYGVLAAADDAPASAAPRRDFYVKMYDEARRRIRGKVDDKERRAAVGALTRQ